MINQINVYVSSDSNIKLRYYTSTMSVNQLTSSNKVQKGKRNSMNRPQSTIDSDIYIAFKTDIDNDTILPAFRTRLHNLFRQIEREFELLYQENQNCK